jgi:hypothetical protein
LSCVVVLLVALTCGISGFAALGSAPVAHEASPLVGQWHFDELTYKDQNQQGPAYTADSSGNGQDLLTCNGCASLQSGGRFSK